ncbi:RING/U-box superfamily protein [Heracleum sosnowskyi]|uniref:RING/U-box superfamily protein n=1 Tax=Heracleum sosnowskyi TaxID=360622 RepID=A0AAD8GWD1_9APIA|nr:RING/U-box superfamily protein [Heracleum sosnowskyi]
MGNGRGKYRRPTRRPQSSGSSKNDRGDVGDRGDIQCDRVNSQVGGQELSCPLGGATNNWLHNFSEEELENFLMNNLQLVYNEAAFRLEYFGYEENVVKDALLKNGYCHGEKDVLSNVLDNTLTYLLNGELDDGRPPFDSLQQLMELSLSYMVYGVQKPNPHLSKRDAMLFLCWYNGLPDQCPEGFNSVKDLARRNGTESADEGCSSNSDKLKIQGNGCSDASLRSETGALIEQNEALQDAKSQDAGRALLDIYRDFNLDESIEYEKDEAIIGLLQLVEDLELQVKERKEWAQQRVGQATTKVGIEVVECNKLRWEREQRLKKGKEMQYRLGQMDYHRRMAVDQLGHINALRSELIFEYDEMSADLEASNLDASDSVRNCAEASKREKKSMKRLLAWEKQKTQLHNETAAMEQQILQLETQLVQVEAAQKDTQSKQKEAQKAKESALAQLEEERRLLKKTDSANKREHSTLHLKIETDVQRHKDELERLELQLSQLNVASKASQLNLHSANFPMVNTEIMETHAGYIEKTFRKLNNQEDYSSDRNCLICAEEEVSVVLLPCAHQVLCLSCSVGRDVCPYCDVPVEDRIKVYDA